PAASMRPIWSTLMFDSVNHMLPSGPAVILRGSLPAVGTRKSLKCPAGATGASCARTTVVVGSAPAAKAQAMRTIARTRRSLYMLQLPGVDGRNPSVEQRVVLFA